MATLFQSAVSKVKEALAGHPEVRLVEGDGSIKVEVDDPSGFDVEMVDDRDEISIFAGPYHTHLDDAEDAAAAFLWMLTPTHRIVEVLRGKHRQSARLEREEDGDWVVLGRVVSLPLFGRKRERVFQNHLLRGPDRE
ncbi:MAG TPA: hypothetical protein VEX38_05370 [Fimbriimonadaceae bacterium]|nr:hypothetical protein [Fimbriimonadaceae bacterium]